MNPAAAAAAANQKEEFKLKDTKPQLGERWPHGGMRGGGGGWISCERATSTYDLVALMISSNRCFICMSGLLKPKICLLILLPETLILTSK
ncbi:hypothetical protein PTKIN_Ptkin06aG0084800 [Pterospermum kingtungense]